MGYIARNDIRRSGGALGGEGLATAGIVIGYIGLALAILGTLVAIFAVVLPIFGCTVCTLCASIGSAIPTPRN
jgi:hypothetical protein